MNKIIIIILAIVTISCAESIPAIDGKNPFVVTAIEATECCGENMSIYTGTDVDGVSLTRFFSGNHQTLPKIVLPSKMYNIGDTISLKK
jgi:hypothetical protein